MLSDPVFDRFIDSFEFGRSAGTALISPALRPSLGRNTPAMQAWEDGFAVGRADAAAAARRADHIRPRRVMAG